MIKHRFHLAAVALLVGACAPAAAPAGAPAPAPPPPAAVPAPTEAPDDWWLLDLATAGVHGTATERAYREILAGRTPEPVIVAVLDSGIEIDHPDLAANIWRNEDEIPGNRIDDDGNLYVDDVHGWNFIGGPDGRNVEQDTYEITRLYALGRTRFANVRVDTLTPEARAEYEMVQAATAEFEQLRAERTELLEQIRNIKAAVDRALTVLKTELGTDSLTEARVRALQSPRSEVMQARSIYLQMAQQGFTQEDIDRDLEALTNMVQYNLNPDFDPRHIVGDDYSDLTQRVYGNNDFEGPDADHGTHVAGIIAAVRGNDLGIDGISTGARIMSVRTVPDGDERDKDVANAIRYAVDNGARIINMSFGKAFSPNKEVVDEAVRHGDARGVLFVHAAGNDAENIDETPSFPTRTFLGASGTAQNWIEVGAISWEAPPALPAGFSNYGPTQVDVFAPGVDILSTVPDGKFEENSGTSMAAPVVTGIAALVWSYFPDLTAAQVKRIIVESATRIPTVQVDPPGEREGPVPFGELSVTGGVVNAYEALRLAEQISSGNR